MIQIKEKYFATIVILLGVIIYLMFNKRKNNKTYVDNAKRIINKYPQDRRPDLYRQMQDKLDEPSRSYFPSTRINIHTRGEELPYQAMGYVFRDESDPNYNPDEINRLVLYGRPDYKGSDIYEYYLISPKDDIKIPLDNTKEIYSGDKVSVRGYSGEWTAEVYEYKEHKYIPYIY
jgi:hypothetical protein